MHTQLLDAKKLSQTSFVIIISIVALLMSSICLAEDNTARSSSSTHDFKHNYKHASLEYRSPLKEGFKGAFFGGAIGLGSGLAIAGVNAAYGGKGEQTGRIVTPFLAAGIIGGAIYGVWDAQSQNSRNEERENKMIDKFGRVAPTIYQTAQNGTGYGLAFSWKLN